MTFTNKFGEVFHVGDDAMISPVLRIRITDITAMGVFYRKAGMDLAVYYPEVTMRKPLLASAPSSAKVYTSSAGVYNPPQPLLPVDINGVPFGLGEMVRHSNWKAERVSGYRQVVALYNDRTMALLATDYGERTASYPFSSVSGGWEVQSRTPALVTITRTVTFTGTPAQIAAYKSNYEERRRENAASSPAYAQLGWSLGPAVLHPETGAYLRVTHYTESSS